jgi:16S rRNA (cytidine1402-2'-O)-methyltransferase
VACKASIPSSNLGATFSSHSAGLLVLYLVATPIGHLADFTYRAVDTLKKCDYLLCEDTRHSAILLNHYEIKKPLKSFHKFNESSLEAEVLNDLRSGKNIALLSDAGTPGIADPGANLVRKCREHGLELTCIPGACAAILALAISGFNTERFQFLGFLPKKQEESKKNLQAALAYPGTSIFYESPNRLKKTLLLLKEISPLRRIGIGRELTKRFEEFLAGTALDLLNRWETSSVKGEIVVLISGDEQPQIDWTELSPQEHVELMEKAYGLSRKEAIKTVAQLRGIPKNSVYNLFHH